MAANAGYLQGVNDPSVFWLNSICASTAAGIIHGMIGGFINVDSGIDWIYEFPVSEWRKTDTEYLQTDDCYFCGTNNSENVVQNLDFQSPEFEDRDFDNSDFVIW